MHELTTEQLAALKIAIDSKTETALAEFDDDLNKVVNRITSKGWTIPSDLGILAIKKACR